MLFYINMLQDFQCDVRKFEGGNTDKINKAQASQNCT